MLWQCLLLKAQYKWSELKKQWISERFLPTFPAPDFPRFPNPLGDPETFPSRFSGLWFNLSNRTFSFRTIRYDLIIFQIKIQFQLNNIRYSNKHNENPQFENKHGIIFTSIYLNICFDTDFQQNTENHTECDSAFSPALWTQIGRFVKN